MTKRELTDQAKKLLEIDKKPNEALVIYQQVWSSYTEERNEWDALYSLKSIRAAEQKQEEWEREVLAAFPENEKINGTNKKLIQICEKKNILSVRKSLVAKKNIKKGEIIKYSMLTAKRPANGLSPISFIRLKGKKSKKNYKINELIK